LAHSTTPRDACSERWNRASDVVLQSAEGVQNLDATGFRKIKSMVLDALVGSSQSTKAIREKTPIVKVTCFRE
jgi:hypothetical protein